MRFVRILAFTVLLPVLSRGQVQVNNLKELLAYADEHSTDAARAKLIPGAARQDRNMQVSGLYPRVNVFATGDYYPVIPAMVVPAELTKGAPGTYTTVQFGLPYVFVAGAELSIPVIDLEKWSLLKRTQLQYEQAQWTEKVAIEALHLQLIQAYYQLLVSRDVAKLNTENIETTTELLRIMSERKDAGILDPSDYNRSLNLKLNTETTDISYRKNIKTLNNNISKMLSLSGDAELVVNGSLDDFDWPMLQAGNGISSRPAWQEAEAKVRVSELALSESRKGGLPKLNLNTRYTFNYQTDPSVAGRDADFQSANIGLRLDFPVFRGNYYRSLQKKSRIQLEMAKLEKLKTEAELRQQQEDWFEQYSAAFAKHTLVEQKVAAASENLRIARLNVKEGLMEFDEFNNIFIEYNQARMEYLQNLADGVLYYLLSTQKF